MSIHIVPAPIFIPGKQSFRYQTTDGSLFVDLDEAVEYDNAYTVKENEKKPIVYEQVWTIQEAINKAAAEKRVVRFIWNGSNADIKKGIVDLKGCKLMKPERDSKDVAVIPPGIEDFDFNEVK